MLKPPKRLTVAKVSRASAKAKARTPGSSYKKG